MPRQCSDAWWQHPEAYLYAWDFAADSARFLPVERATLARSGFLDRRIDADPARARPVPIAEVLASPIAGARNDPAFIFHTAFCCSTLLARSLDLPGRSLVLREPAVLLQLADLNRGLVSGTREPAELLGPTLDLLARPFAPAEGVIIKPTNLVNNLIAELLAARPASRALILYDELEPFLISVLKRPGESGPGIESFLRRLLRDPAADQLPQKTLNVSDLPRRAALAWALQISALQRELVKNGRDRIRLLRTPELLARPTATIAAASQWLQAPLSTAESGTVAAGPLWTRHAKHSALAYTPERRHKEQALARQLLAEPLRAGLDYAQESFEEDAMRLPRDLHLLL